MVSLRCGRTRCKTCNHDDGDDEPSDEEPHRNLVLGRLPTRNAPCWSDRVYSVELFGEERIDENLRARVQDDTASGKRSRLSCAKASIAVSRETAHQSQIPKLHATVENEVPTPRIRIAEANTNNNLRRAES